MSGRSPKIPSKKDLPTLTAIVKVKNVSSAACGFSVSTPLSAMTYSEFMGKVNAKGISLNRKVLADLAMNNPKAFEKVVKTVK